MNPNGGRTDADKWREGEWERLMASRRQSHPSVTETIWFNVHRWTARFNEWTGQRYTAAWTKRNEKPT